MYNCFKFEGKRRQAKAKKKGKPCDTSAVNDINKSEQSIKKSNGFILIHCKFHYKTIFLSFTVVILLLMKKDSKKRRLKKSDSKARIEELSKSMLC